MENRVVTTYIEGLSAPWQQAIATRLRELLHKADPDIVENIKWGTPFFEHDGPVAWLYCAKSWVHFSFPQGALLDNSHGLFEKTDNKGQRTLKFREGDTLPEAVIIKLVKQAVGNNQAGQKIDFKIPKPGTQEFDTPKEYEDFLQEAGMIDQYNARPYYQRKGWIQWIEEAKQPATQARRKAIMLKQLHDGTYMPPKN